MCWPSKSFLSLAKHSVNSRVEILEWFQIFSRFDTLRALALFGFRLLNKCIYFVCDFPHSFHFSLFFSYHYFGAKRAKKDLWMIFPFSSPWWNINFCDMLLCAAKFNRYICFIFFFSNRDATYQKHFQKRFWEFKKVVFRVDISAEFCSFKVGYENLYFQISISSFIKYTKIIFILYAYFMNFFLHKTVREKYRYIFSIIWLFFFNHKKVCF